jgi:protein TonB
MPTKQARGIALSLVIILVFGYLQLRPQQAESYSIVLKPVKTVYPTYPDHLRKEGISGEVIIWAWVDERGNVEIRDSHQNCIARSLHPELDKLAMEAVRQWKYEPPQTLGMWKGVWTFISIVFDPGELPEVEESPPAEPMSDSLLAVLDQSWEYCRKMHDIADFYLCRERIYETSKSVVNVGHTIIGSVSEKKELKTTVRVGCYIPDLANPKTLRYVNDYQITSRNSRVVELRTPVRQPSSERDSPFGKKTLSFPIPAYVPGRLLAPGFRDEYQYSLKEDDKIRGVECRVIDLKARKRRGIEIQKATLWIERTSARVVRVDFECDASAIDERILAECRQYYIAPHLRARYDYGEDIKGIRFPSRLEIILDYSHLEQANTRDTKMKLDIKYDHYRFFTVETDSRIIRNQIPIP